MGYWPLVKKVAREADIILVVGDARMPEFSKNKEVKRFIRMYKKDFISVYNKIDLLSKKSLYKLKEDYSKSMFISAKEKTGVKELKKRLLDIKEQKKLKIIRVGLIGYPNMGKSALINSLIKKDKLSVSGRAGTTKDLKWISSEGISIIDSPGVIPFKDRELHLAILGAKDPEKIKNLGKIVQRIIKMFLVSSPSSIEDRYGFKIDEGDDEEDVFIKIANKKGFLVKGGVVDERRASLFIIKEWQSGKLRFN